MELLIAFIAVVTIMTGRFLNDLHQVIVCDFTHLYGKISNNFIKKLDMPLEMTKELSNLIKEFKNNTNYLNVMHSSDHNSYKSKNIISYYSIQNLITPQITTGHLRFESL